MLFSSTIDMRQVIHTTILTLALALAGCVSSANNDLGTEREVLAEAVIPDPQRLPETDSSRCEAMGGNVQTVCRLGLPTCVLPYSDAGKSCSDSAQCKGSCWLADLKQGESIRPGELAIGECQSDSNICGCHFEILGGIIQPGICVD